ncbi:hypothetical protein BpHYR1_040417 [Brachionus plicatilis]|uniref:Uncharacterized protein n=1 Tax=Brachionus plicatilis TaxID=10195 RepID=A0A3M7PLA9_BRAPC|nr:hypothetical protein BpHYR1_040417 [Brachionus plicatilis]
MTLSDNSNALLTKRKMTRRTQSQSTASSPSIQSTSQNSNQNLVKEKMVKSHSDSKRLYRSSDLMPEKRSAESRKKTPQEIEFEEKINQLNRLKNSASNDEFNKINYSLGEEINEMDRNNVNKNEFASLSHEKINKISEKKNHSFLREVTKDKDQFRSKPISNKLTDWNDDKTAENNADPKDTSDTKISHSILKSLNMYRF